MKKIFNKKIGGKTADTIYHIFLTVVILFVVTILLSLPFGFNFVKHKRVKQLIYQAGKIHNYIENQIDFSSYKDLDCIIQSKGYEDVYINDMDYTLEFDWSEEDVYWTAVIQNNSLQYVLVSKEKIEVSKIKEYADFNEQKKIGIGCSTYKL